MSRYTSILEFDLPWDELTFRDKRELKEYIEEAIEGWGGQRHPDDWLFYSTKKVKVTHLKLKETKT